MVGPVSYNKQDQVNDASVVNVKHVPQENEKSCE
jgi:hypothetical protein